MQHGLARSGLLYMSEERIGFEPRRIDALFGARPVCYDLSAIDDIRLKPTLRKLRVTVFGPGGRERFIVSDARLVFQDLQSWLASRAQMTSPVQTRSRHNKEGGSV